MSVVDYVSIFVAIGVVLVMCISCLGSARRAEESARHARSSAYDADRSRLKAASESMRAETASNEARKSAVEVVVFCEDETDPYIKPELKQCRTAK